jgi:DegV family protein with EDD domain
VNPNPGPTAVVTDSAADVPAALAERYGIHVVPVILVVDGRSLQDGQGISRQAFYDAMPSMVRPPTTATPSPEAFAAAYGSALAAGAGHVLSMHVSGQLSGIAAMARQAAAAFGDQVEVIDTGQVSLGAGFQVLAAGRAALAGASLKAVLAAVESVRKRIRVLAMIDDLEYLRRSGRISWLRSSLAALLHVRVLVEMTDGVVRRLGQVRSRARAIESLVETAEAWGDLEQLGVLHSSALDDALALAARLASRASQAPIVVDVTTVIGAHVGPRSLGLVGVRAEASPGRGS